ncbi:MAG: hypothetical protein ABMA25_24625 [Ilumatobacteraceae bacterium]
MSTAADRHAPARSLRRGVLFGVLAGALAGAVWYLVVLGTTSMQTYLLPAFGVAVAFGVSRGMRSPGRTAALVAVGLTVVALAIAMYYVERKLIIAYFSENGDAAHIPLVPYLDWVVAVDRHALTKSPSPPIYSVLALVAAGWFGYKGVESQPHRRLP